LPPSHRNPFSVSQIPIYDFSGQSNKNTGHPNKYHRSPGGDRHLVWDDAGNLTTFTDCSSYEILGNRIGSRLPDNRQLHWMFYGSGHLHQINLETEGKNQTACEIERDALHREVKRT
jgi:hypothetical protein